MNHRTESENRVTRRIRRIAVAAALALALTVVLPQPAHARLVPPPPVPSDLEVPDGNRAFIAARAAGTQDYICLPTASGFAWTFLRPQATLFNDFDRQIITHFLSPNPDEAGTPRATWQHSVDTSAVWARAIASSTDPDFVEPGAIPWLLLEVVGTQEGPTGGSRLLSTTFIQRVNTTGGSAPSTGCGQSVDVGVRAFVPYTTVYIFYRAVTRDTDASR